MPHPSTVPLDNYLTDLLSLVRFADLQAGDVLALNLHCGSGTPSIHVTPAKLSFLAEDGGPPPVEDGHRDGTHLTLTRNGVDFVTFVVKS